MSKPNSSRNKAQSTTSIAVRIVDPVSDSVKEVLVGPAAELLRNETKYTIKFFSAEEFLNVFFSGTLELSFTQEPTSEVVHIWGRKPITVGTVDYYSVQLTPVQTNAKELWIRAHRSLTISELESLPHPVFKMGCLVDYIINYKLEGCTTDWLVGLLTNDDVGFINQDRELIVGGKLLTFNPTAMPESYCAALKNMFRLMVLELFQKGDEPALTAMGDLYNVVSVARNSTVVLSSYIDKANESLAALHERNKEPT
jgi:hypothetical protein